MQLDLQLWENLKHWSFENQNCGVQFLSHPSAETLLKSFALELQNMQTQFLTLSH